MRPWEQFEFPTALATSRAHMHRVSATVAHVHACLAVRAT